MDSSVARLNKQLALLIGTSRREADEIIQNGRVTINGAVATLGARVHVNDDVISLDGTPLGDTPRYRYVLFHKPVGYVCSRRAQGDAPTIYDLLPDDMRSLKPVGRLDKDSSGVLLLTNDGDTAHRMTHPGFRKTKVYSVTLDAPLAPLHQQMISDYGVEIGDGVSKLSLERMDESRTEWTIKMSEGRNRQIRRTFAALGYTVVGLHRTHFGAYSLDSLEPGAWANSSMR